MRSLEDDSDAAQRRDRRASSLRAYDLDQTSLGRERAARDRLERTFERAFGPTRATHVVRAPGRVNLIGDHTDYNGLPVLPMAIDRNVWIVLRGRDDARVRLVDVDAAFAPRKFEITDAIVPFERGDWGNYAKAAAQVLRARFGIVRGFDGAVFGDIPPAAGLSSSSALVVACALALVQSNDIDVTREELMSLTALGERYVGTQSGGMDQAICLGARERHACKIDFEPLRLTHVSVPSDWRFVIAHSGVEAKKSGAAQAGYNARVGECREALARVLARPRANEWPTSYAGLIQHASNDQLLGVGDTALDDQLRRRFRHVVTEGRRVELAHAAMVRGDIEGFGALMNESHASLRDDYEVSCAELDALVARALDSGAIGARLTGAGFGGCIVALARSPVVSSIMSACGALVHGATSRDRARAPFVTSASAAADVIRCRAQT